MFDDADSLAIHEVHFVTSETLDPNTFTELLKYGTGLTLVGPLLYRFISITTPDVDLETVQRAIISVLRPIVVTFVDASEAERPQMLSLEDFKET